jgi:fatty-acyl-CoA synthase
MRGPAFSTLACPAWTLEQALARGREYGYRAVELRLVDGELIEDSMPAAERSRVGTLLSDSGLELVAVDSSIRLTEDEPAVVAERIARFLDLAAGWHSPLVRVFGGPGKPENAARALRLASREAERSGVRIGLETHDEFSSAASVAAVLDVVDSPDVGAIWDIVHTNRVGETPAAVIAHLGDRIVDVHVKDARRTNPTGPWQDGFGYVLLGQGEVPVRACLEGLQAAGYQHWVVAEWEKRWHPEIEEPEVALPQHAKVLNEWLTFLSRSGERVGERGEGVSG